MEGKRSTAKLPPFPGCVMLPKRSATGRLWRVAEAITLPSGLAYRMRPIGWDVMPAQEHGRFNGGVRSIIVPSKRLRSAWRPATYRECDRQTVVQDSKTPDYLCRD